MNQYPHPHGHIVSTPDGPFALIEDSDGAVVAAGWTDDVGALARLSRCSGVEDVSCGGAEGGVLGGGSGDAGAASAGNAQSRCRAVQAVIAYYAGDLGAPDDVPLAATGTVFQQRVWQELRRIPAGQSRTYGELAALAGSPSAIRAAGSACARNPIALFVPCHRIVSASGSLTGFAWGIDVKRSLLEREGALPATLPV